MQIVTLVIGLMAATALWSGVEAINAEARSSYDRAASVLGEGNSSQLVPAQGATVPESLFAHLRRGGWFVSPIIEGRVRIGNRQLRVVGIEPLSLPAGAMPSSGLRGLVSEGSALQNFLSPLGETLVSPDTARDLGAGDGVRLSSESRQLLPPLRIATGLVTDLLVTDIGWAQQILQQPGRVSRFLLDTAAGGERSPLASVAGDSLRLIEAGAETDLQRLTASFHLNLTAFGLLSFLVGLFIVYAAIGLAFEQRLPMMRTLRACGVSARSLIIVLIAELICLSVLAGIAGVICGYLIASALLPNVAASLRGLYGASVPAELSIAPWWWAVGVAMSIAGALVAASHALIKVLRLPLLVSAQPFAWQAVQRRWLIWQGALACIAFSVAAGALWFGTSLVAGFTVLAGLLLGAALLLPVALDLILTAGERSARGPVSQWVWSDSRQQLSGLSLALMALLLALAVNVGVGTMVGSFSNTFQRWIDGRLAADIYIEARENAQAATIETWLRARPDVQATLPSARAETTMGSEAVELLGLADHATYRELWPLLESTASVWDNVRNGSSVLISEQLSRRLALRLGDTVRIPSPGGEWVAIVGGLYADYGNPKGQIAVNVDELVRRFPDADRSRFGIRAAEADVAGLITELERMFELGTRRVANQATLKTESLRVFNRTFAVTATLSAFTLGVAGVALFTSLLTLGQARLPQLAPLWAIGLTRQKLAWLELAKTLALALVTALLALPLGIVVAWCLIEVVNVKAFGWRLPLEVFPAQLGRLLLVAMLAACLAAAFPVIKLARTRPIALLKIFSDER